MKDETTIRNSLGDRYRALDGSTRDVIHAVGGATAGGTLLGWLGSSAGIVAFGGGIAATIPAALVGLVIGATGVYATKQLRGRKKDEDAPQKE